MRVAVSSGMVSLSLLGGLLVGCGTDPHVPSGTFDMSIDVNVVDMGTVPTDMPRTDMPRIDMAIDMPGPVCGNWTVEGTEECDDGDMESMDGCSATCTIEGTCDMPLDFDAIASPAVDGVRTFSSDTVSARDTLNSEDCGTDGGKDMVFSYTPTTNGLLQIDTNGSTFDTVVYVRTTCGSAASELGCDDDGGDAPSSALSIISTAGTPLFIVLDGYGSDDSGVFELNIREVPLGAAGDTCALDGSGIRCGAGLVCVAGESAATCVADGDLGCGMGVPVFDVAIVDGVGTFTGTTELGSTVLDGSCDLSGSTSPSEIVHKFVMPVEGTFTAFVDTSFDSVTYVYTGSCGGAETVCTDSSTLVRSSLADIPAGTTVFVVVDGWASDERGAYTLTISVSPAATVGGACGPELTDAHCGAGTVCHTDVCAMVMCNDAIVEGDEDCEDGNVMPGDGCSADCHFEDFGVGGDMCAGVVPLTLVPTSSAGTFGARATGSTTGLSADFTSPDCGTGTTASPDVVYSFTITEERDITASLRTVAPFQGAVSIRGPGEATCTMDGTEIDCDSGTGTNYAYAFSAAAGTYYVVVDGVGDEDANDGMYTLEIESDPPFEFDPEL